MIAFTCIMGISTVFIGLICLIAITTVMSSVIKKLPAGKNSAENNVPAVKASASKSAPIQNKQEILAGVCAVIAEELGTDVSNIRVKSFKKL